MGLGAVVRNRSLLALLIFVALAVVGGLTGLQWWSINSKSTAESDRSFVEIEPVQLIGPEWIAIRSQLGNSNQGRKQIFKNEVGSGSAAAYRRGLEMLVRGDAGAALAAFDEMRPEEVPGDLAYPPYRLQSAMRPESRSAYAQPMLEAIAKGDVPRIVAARVLAQEGLLAESLAAYAATNPSSWTGHDLQCLRGIARDGALKVDLDRIVWRALTRPRLDSTVEKGLVSLVRNSGSSGFEERFRRRVDTDPKARKIAADSLQQMQEARSLFMEQRYGQLLDRFGQKAPTQVTTEMSTVLFLSALKLHRVEEVYRWGQELKRRHPDRELADWVAKLTRGVQEGPS